MPMLPQNIYFLINTLLEMVKNYQNKKPGSRGYVTYSEEILEKCFEAVRSGKLHCRSSKYLSAIQNKLKGANSGNVYFLKRRKLSATDFKQSKSVFISHTYMRYTRPQGLWTGSMLKSSNSPRRDRFSGITSLIIP